MDSYLIEVSELLDSIGSSLSCDDPFDLTSLVVGEERFQLVEPATVNVVLTNAGSGIVAAGSVQALVTAECARCLRTYETSLAGDVEGFYVSRNSAADEDAELITAEGSVDLAPALIAALVIAAPFVPLHDPGCLGLCSKCGADLNEGPCGCPLDADDSHPFAALRDLMPDVSDAPDSD